MLRNSSFSHFTYFSKGIDKFFLICTLKLRMLLTINIEEELWDASYFESLCTISANLSIYCCELEILIII